MLSHKPKLDRSVRSWAMPTEARASLTAPLKEGTVTVWLITLLEHGDIRLSDKHPWGAHGLGPFLQTSQAASQFGGSSGPLFCSGLLHSHPWPLPPNSSPLLRWLFISTSGKETLTSRGLRILWFWQPPRKTPHPVFPQLHDSKGPSHQGIYPSPAWLVMNIQIQASHWSLPLEGTHHPEW